ncbi:RNA polymerase sigma factor [Polaribacter batillariae]|uniref:RNA polymerase sigma factor n=1 Tax=Polaribacter batillariae TaxID=2808900 RepID=A0ABX7SVM2_9FLAO|nr:RNA polymerase sigma factor [Polaribacter batillariae]QTD38302.1 RNA polymerase sigma factor [Polaribacter batillariae]
MEANQPHITKLLERCKSQDKNAQLALYKRYYNAMYNTSYRILKDAFEAEDVMQEAFLTAFTKIQMYKGEVTFGAWLKRIVINKSLTQLKKNSRYLEVKMEVIPNDNEQEETIEYTELKAETVLNCLQNLKENYRLVLNLHLVEGYDYEEIAQILNYTNENVRTTVSRAKKKLKQILLAKNTQTQAYER